MTAICTPTKTRAEFESILRELDGVGVKWESGDPPLDPWCLDYYFTGCVISYKWDGKSNLMCGYLKSDKEKQLPRADFIAAIKRDFAPKEQPKMKIYTDITPDALVIISESLEEKSTVKWYSGDKPTTRTNLGLNTHLAFNYGNTRALSHGLSKTYDGSLEWVTNKEFINLVTRELPREKPKMNYNKMLKKDLITELKKRDAAIKSMNTHGEHIAKELTNQAEKTRSALQSLKMANVWVDKYDALEKTNEEFKAKWTEQDRQLNEALNDRDTLRGIANTMTHRCTELEKTNAEQAETIEQLNRARDGWEEESIRYAKNSDYHEGKREEAETDNLRLRRLAAQMLCPDVLEGK